MTAESDLAAEVGSEGWCHGSAFAHVADCAIWLVIAFVREACTLSWSVNL